jgi:hypothetical protein
MGLGKSLTILTLIAGCIDATNLYGQDGRIHEHSKRNGESMGGTLIVAPLSSECFENTRLVLLLDRFKHCQTGRNKSISAAPLFLPISLLFTLISQGSGNGGR